MPAHVMSLHFEYSKGRKHAQGCTDAFDNGEHLSHSILSYLWWLSPSPSDNLCLRRYANNETLLINIEDVFWFKVVLTNQLCQPLEVVS